MLNKKGQELGGVVMLFVVTVAIVIILIVFISAFSVLKVLSGKPSAGGVDSRVEVNDYLSSNLNYNQFSSLLDCKGKVKNEEKSFYEVLYMWNSGLLNIDEVRGFVDNLDKGCYVWLGIAKISKVNEFLVCKSGVCNKRGAININRGLLDKEIYLEVHLMDYKIFVSSVDLEEASGDAYLETKEWAVVDYG